MSIDRSLAITGQVGNKPHCFIWASDSGELKSHIELPKGSRGISAVCFSPDAQYAALVDLSQNYQIYLVNVGSGKILNQGKSGSHKVYDLEWFTDKAGNHIIGQSGVKAM